MHATTIPTCIQAAVTRSDLRIHYPQSLNRRVRDVQDHYSREIMESIPGRSSRWSVEKPNGEKYTVDMAEINPEVHVGKSCDCIDAQSGHYCKHMAQLTCELAGVTLHTEAVEAKIAKVQAQFPAARITGDTECDTPCWLCRGTKTRHVSFYVEPTCTKPNGYLFYTVCDDMECATNK